MKSSMDEGKVAEKHPQGFAIKEGLKVELILYRGAYGFTGWTELSVFTRLSIEKQGRPLKNLTVAGCSTSPRSRTGNNIT